MQGVYIHPTAIVESDHVGPDTRIWAFAHVMAGATVGRNCVIGDHGFVEAGAVIGDNVTLKNHVCVWEGITIEDDVFIGPFVSLTNDVYPRSPRMAAVKSRYDEKGRWLVHTTIEKGSTIGANATLVAGARVGRHSMVGAGSVVVGDVEPFALVIGNPARKVGYLCQCGRRLGLTLPHTECPQCGMAPEMFRESL